MDSILCAKFHVHILSGFWDTSKLNNNNNEKKKKLKTDLFKYRLCDLSHFLDTCCLCQKLDLIEIESET